MKKLLVGVMAIAIGLVLYSFKQQPSEKSLITIRVYEACEKCDGVARIIISGDGAEKVSQLEYWDAKNPESNTNLELIRYSLRTYYDQGFKISAFTSLISGGQEITTYVLIKE
jgi:hypothetical protein